jgi:hypothetical protein
MKHRQPIRKWGTTAEQHIPVHIADGVWPRYAYCALMSKMHRTRYQFAGCGVPLCSMYSLVRSNERIEKGGTKNRSLQKFPNFNRLTMQEISFCWLALSECKHQSPMVI